MTSAKAAKGNSNREMTVGSDDPMPWTVNMSDYPTPAQKKQ